MASARKRGYVTECEAGRLLGPLDRSSFPHVLISPFGVILKSEPGKWQLILDSSSPEGNSVNDGINSLDNSLSYVSVDNIAARVIHKGRGALMAKRRRTGNTCPPDDRWLLDME